MLRQSCRKNIIRNVPDRKGDIRAVQKIFENYTDDFSCAKSESLILAAEICQTDTVQNIIMDDELGPYFYQHL